MEAEWRFGIPIDHRLKRLLSQAHNGPAGGNWSLYLNIPELWAFGPAGQARSPPPSEEEIAFGQKLVGPMTRGGLVLALMQPALNHRYNATTYRDPYCKALFA